MLVLLVLTSMIATLTLYSVSCVPCFMCLLSSVLISNIGSIANRAVKVQVEKIQTFSDNLSTIIIIITTHTDPWVVHKLSNGHPLVGLRFQQLNDELFGYTRSEKNTKSNNVHLFIHPFIKQVKHQVLGRHLNKQNVQSNRQIRLLSKLLLVRH